MNIKKLFSPAIAALLVLIIGASVAYAGWGTWDYLQKQKYNTCWKGNCYQLLMDQNWSEYMECSQNCYNEAENYDSNCATCEDTDGGVDYLVKGTVTTDTKPEGVEDYCYTFSNGKTYLMEGKCKNGKYIRYQKNCKELGMKYDCLEGACVYVNNAPVFEDGLDGTVHEVGEGESLTIAVGATDEDGDDLTFYAEGLPEGATFENGVPAGGPLPEDVQYGIFEWDPEFGQAGGEYEITLYTSDGELEDSIVITVNFESDIIWSKLYSGPSEESWASDSSRKIVQTTDGGYIVVGIKYLEEEAGPDLWVIKLDEDGDLEWEKVIDSPVEGERYGGKDIIQDSEGNYVIAGAFIDSQPYEVNSLLIKLDPQGDIIWERNWFELSEYQDGANTIVETNDGYIFLSNCVMGFDITQSFLVKANKEDGSKIWSKTFVAHQSGKSLHKTNDGGFIITGATTNYGGGTVNRIWLLKTDSEGPIGWNKDFELDYEAEGFSVTQDTNNNYVVTGWWCTGGWNSSCSGFLMKTDSEGNQLWTNLFESEGTTMGRSVIVTDDGDYLMTGYGVYFLGGGVTKVLSIKTNPDGDEQWTKVFDENSPSWSQGWSGIQTNDGNFAFAGMYRPELGVNNWDVWVVKYSE